MTDWMVRTKKFVELFQKEGKKIRTGFVINEDEYSKFRSFCKKRGIIPSTIIDLIIRDFNSNFNTEEK